MARVFGPPLPASPAARDHVTIALISIGHFVAHFYILVLPPLFPVLAPALGVGYAQLGIALAILNATTALFQAPIGFLVDRHGPFAILVAGQTLFAAAIAAIGLFPSYPTLLICAVLAGLGNAVYHPADYAILAGRVSDARMGRAFSIHTFGGYAGFATAPIVMVALTEWFGWQTALMLAGLLGLLVSACFVLFREVIGVAESAPPAGPRAARADLALLSSRPILLALLFFTFLALSQSGLNSFTVAALERLYGFTLLAANAPLTVFLVASTFGVLLGGVLADRTRRHDRVVGACFVGIALISALVAAVPLAYPLLLAAFAGAGLAFGIVAPSRDMLVRAITPPGASGKVFGFVTTGFNIGGLLAPPMFGFVVDLGLPQFVFLIVAALSLVTLPLVLIAGHSGRMAGATAATGDRAGAG